MERKKRKDDRRGDYMEGKNKSVNCVEQLISANTLGDVTYHLVCDFNILIFKILLLFINQNLCRKNNIVEKNNNIGATEW